MEIWIIFAVVAALCCAIGIFIAINNKTASVQNADVYDLTLSETNMFSDIPLPNQWNEANITNQLRQLRNQRPAAINHFVNSILERFVIKQDDQTAVVRLQFMRTQIDQLKLTKEFLEVRADLQVMSLEIQKRIKTLQLDHLELDQKRDRRTKLSEFEMRKDQLELELSIASLEKQIADIKTPSRSEPERKKTPQQEREEKRAYRESEVDRLVSEKAKALAKIPKEDEERRRRTENLYDDAIEKALQELSKFL